MYHGEMPDRTLRVVRRSEPFVRQHLGNDTMSVTAADALRLDGLYCIHYIISFGGQGRRGGRLNGFRSAISYFKQSQAI
jgi:hypothetical protein